MNGYENIPMVTQPEELKIGLYPHQLASIYNLEKLEENPTIETSEFKMTTRIGVFADMTGYGKTLSIVGLILRDKRDWDGTQPYTLSTTKSYMEQSIQYIKKERFPTMPQTVILVNPSIVHQWVKEFSYTPLQVRVITKQTHISDIQEEDDNVIITVPTMFNALMIKYSGVVWKRFVYDEPSNLRVPSMKKIRAGFTWFVTATPDDIQIHHSNCTGFMNDLFYDFYKLSTIRDTVVVHNDPNFVTASYQMPPTYYYKHACYSSLVNSIHNYVHPRIKKLLEANNISEALQLMGGKRTDSIYKLLVKQKQEEKDHIEAKLKLWQGRNKPNKVLQWKQKYNKVVIDMEGIEQLYKQRLSESCSICFEKLSEPMLEPSCQNLFCGKCLLTWLQEKKTCPLCREEIKVNELIYETEVKSESENKIEYNTKEHVILELIQNKSDGRFIIFSEWTNSFRTLFYELKNLGVEYSLLQGSVETRGEILEKFRKGDIKVLLLTTLENASGLNLIETTDIILYHSMNESTQRQIIGRANRIGRITNLSVHSLVYI